MTEPDAHAGKALVRRLYEEVIDGGDMALADHLLAPGYIQHNPSAGQGIEGFKKYFADLDKTKRRLRATSSLEILSLMAEGDRVFIHTVTRMNGTRMTGWVKLRFESMDVFRVENNRLAEHWDVVQGRSLLSALVLLAAG